MADRLPLKLYTEDGEFIAACKHAECAANVIANWHEGTIRYGHALKRIVWTEGVDGDAGQSADECAEKVHRRIKAMGTTKIGGGGGGAALDRQREVRESGNDPLCTGPGCGHKKSKHYGGRGMCEYPCANGICLCSRFCSR